MSNHETYEYLTVLRFGTVRRASQVTGYTENAIRTKISTGVWPEGLVWKWAPDGVQLIDFEGFNLWCQRTGKASMRGRRQSA